MSICVTLYNIPILRRGSIHSELPRKCRLLEKFMFLCTRNYQVLWEGKSNGYLVPEPYLTRPTKIGGVYIPFPGLIHSVFSSSKIVLLLLLTILS
jgi:hypothetical protein